MKSQRIPMTWEEYEVMPWRLGWKHEYFDGTAFLTPRDQSVVTVVEVKPQTVTPIPFQLRPVVREDAQQLKELFFNVFHDSVEFCNQQAQQIRDSANQCIDNFMKNDADPFSSLSQVAVSSDGSLLGTALVIEDRHGHPYLRLLCVDEEVQRQGIGTSMVTRILNALASIKVAWLYSRYFLANEWSRKWHHHFGFHDQPDVFVTRLYYRHAQHELFRQEKLGQVSDVELLRLESIVHKWEDVLEKQEAQWERELLGQVRLP